MIKNTVLFFALMLFAVTAQSQITKGNWLMGGNASFTLSKYNSEFGQKNTDFVLQIAPDIGYFVIDKLAAGLKVSLYKHGNKATGTSVYRKHTTVDFGPFVRYHFLPVDNIANILVDAAYQHGTDNYGTSNYVSDKNPTNTFSFAAGPVIYFNTSVGLEFLMGYSTTKYTGFAGSNGTIHVSLGLQVHLEKDR